ncbi:DUF1579 family protein [Dyella tabacisoli]|uniref:DUF1579 domain-containing protein n=1 Tax=Dyella tabacisoli TaxID=2282381 RepID=A0A369UT47_9GAMM|nr:DUF1579 family protein [Dyella tabacisoli]RDD83225.1 DUF1579 domain-containing protein [Dyella tabacisoli]
MPPFFSIPRRRVFISTLAGLAATCVLAFTVNAGPATKITAQPTVAAFDHVHDFDKFFGTWHSKQRRLKERLAGNNQWIEFEGSQTVRPVLNGHGNMTDNVFTMPDGVIYSGVTLRAFDPASQTWSIWWLDGNRPTQIDVPVVGSFENGIGTFYANDTFNGKPIKVRFRWLNITATTLQWEQAFSPDGGKTWETNWIAYFTKTG